MGRFKDKFSARAKRILQRLPFFRQKQAEPLAPDVPVLRVSSRINEQMLTYLQGKLRSYMENLSKEDTSILLIHLFLDDVRQLRRQPFWMFTVTAFLDEFRSRCKLNDGDFEWVRQRFFIALTNSRPDEAPRPQDRDALLFFLLNFASGILAYKDLGERRLLVNAYLDDIRCMFISMDSKDFLYVRQNFEQAMGLREKDET